MGRQHHIGAALIVGAVLGLSELGCRSTPLAVPASSADPAAVSVSGLVEDRDGDPCEALIRACGADDPWHQFSTRSGSDGRFTLHLAAGRWAIRAEGDDLVSEAEEIEIGADREVTIRLYLEDEAAWANGRVLSPSGDPVAGARVDHLDRCGHLQSFCVTDSDGTYGLLVPRDEVELRASAPSYAPFLAWVCAHKEEGLRADLRLLAEAAIEGRVIDHEGRPIAGARVTAKAAGDSWDKPYEVPPSAVSGTEGRYRILGLQTRVHTLAAEALGHGPGQAVQAPANSSAPDLVLPRGGRIEGKVVRSEDGAPLADAQVSLEYVLRSIGDTTWGGLDLYWTQKMCWLPGEMPNTVHVPRQGSVDAEGRFSFEDLVPGRYLVVASTADRPPCKSAPVVVLDDRASSSVSVRVARGARLRGVVIDAQTGRTVPGTFVHHPKDGMHADAQGRFSFTALRAGSHLLEWWRDGFARAEQTVELSEGEDREVTLQIERAARVRGQVQTIAGEQCLPSVSIGTSWRTRRFWTRLGEDRSYELSGFPLGRQAVICEMSLGNVQAVVSRVVDFQAGQQVCVNFAPPSGALLRGTLSPGRTPVGLDVTISRREDGDGLRFELHPDSTGVFEIPGVPPGEYLARVGGFATAITVPSGVPVVERRFELPPKILTVRVTDAWTREGIHGARIECYRDGRMVGCGFGILGDASYSLWPGEHTLRVMRVGYREERLTVEVEEGGPTRIEVELVPLW